MVALKLERHPPLTQQVAEILIERIKTGTYPSRFQLPPENKLAEEFDVSRATVRGALNTLATMGLLIRRHGTGTFVSQVPPISNPLDKAIDFQDLIAENECCPGIRDVYSGLESASARMAADLKIETGAKVLVIQKVFTADDDPMIFCINTFPLRLFKPELLDRVLKQPVITEPIYDFLKQECDQLIEYQISRIRPSRARACPFWKPLPFEPNKPILVIDEIAYNAQEIPLFHTFEYHPENKMTFEIVRRWIHK